MDATYRGGGWQLLMTSMHPRDMIGGSNHPMGSVNINQDAPTLTGKYTRNLVNVVKPAIGDEFMILQKEGKWKTFIMTHTFCGFNSRSSGVCNGCHGTYAKGQIYNEDNSKVNCGGAGKYNIPGRFVVHCASDLACVRTRCIIVGVNIILMSEISSPASPPPHVFL
jgi:hypothetical protein